MADDFFFCFFVGKKKELACGDGRLQADDGTIAEDENGFCGFGKRLALVAAVESARTVDGDGNFQRDGLRFRSGLARRGARRTRRGERLGYG